MKTEYFCCYHSYLKKIAKLSDQEVGRLFRSLLQYSATGESPELAGRESIAFDFIADDIDRAKKNYEQKCEKNRENALAGISERKRTVANASERKRTGGIVEYKDKDKEKDKINPPLPPFGGKAHSESAAETFPAFSEPLQSAVNDWFAYKSERREAYKPTGKRNLLTQIENNEQKYGARAVAEIIRVSMSCNYQGILWDRLDSVNRGKEAVQKGYSYDDTEEGCPYG